MYVLIDGCLELNQEDVVYKSQVLWRGRDDLDDLRMNAVLGGSCLTENIHDFEREIQISILMLMFSDRAVP
jgi:hypothetical protein